MIIGSHSDAHLPDSLRLRIVAHQQSSPKMMKTPDRLLRANRYHVAIVCNASCSGAVRGVWQINSAKPAIKHNRFRLVSRPLPVVYIFDDSTDSEVADIVNPHLTGLTFTYRCVWGRLREDSNECLVPGNAASTVRLSMTGSPPATQITIGHARIAMYIGLPDAILINLLSHSTAMGSCQSCVHVLPHPLRRQASGSLHTLHKLLWLGILNVSTTLSPSEREQSTLRGRFAKVKFKAPRATARRRSFKRSIWKVVCTCFHIWPRCVAWIDQRFPCPRPPTAKSTFFTIQP